MNCQLNREHCGKENTMALRRRRRWQQKLNKKYINYLLHISVFILCAINSNEVTLRKRRNNGQSFPCTFQRHTISHMGAAAAAHECLYCIILSIRCASLLNVRFNSFHWVNGIRHVLMTRRLNRRNFFFSFHVTCEYWVGYAACVANKCELLLSFIPMLNFICRTAFTHNW